MNLCKHICNLDLKFGHYQVIWPAAGRHVISFLDNKHCSVTESAGSFLWCVLNLACNSRSTAAESYLKDEIWHVPDKPAVPVGEQLAFVWRSAGR